MNRVLSIKKLAKNAKKIVVVEVKKNGSEKSCETCNGQKISKVSAAIRSREMLLIRGFEKANRCKAARPCFSFAVGIFSQEHRKSLTWAEHFDAARVASRCDL